MIFCIGTLDLGWIHEKRGTLWANGTQGALAAENCLHKATTRASRCESFVSQVYKVPPISMDLHFIFWAFYRSSSHVVFSRYIIRLRYNRFQLPS